MVTFGDPRLPTRFWDKVIPEPNTGCWLWVGCRNKKGYGSFRLAGRTFLAHRLAYVSTVAQVPDGADLDHVRARGCCDRGCVNPGHLEPVSHLENVRRGVNWQSAKEECDNGHPFNEENTYWWNGMRFCRPCRTERQRQKRARAKAAVLVAAILFVSGCYSWNAADTAAQVAVTASLAVDYNQTRKALDEGGVEQNPVINAVGPHPYFLGAAALAAGAAAALPRPWRGVLQGAIFAVQVDTITGNWVRFGRVW